jgi:hypothetical protein
VNASAEQTIIDGWTATSQSGDYKFAFVTYATESIAGYAASAFAVNQAYVESNGHLMRLADPAISNYEPQDARWNKVKILERAFNTFAKDCDYLVWLDADLILLDFSMDLSRIVRTHPKGEFYVSLSTSTDLMNSGFVILKNSKWVRDWLLPEWWRSDDRGTSSDQEVFNQLYVRHKQDQQLSSRVVLLEPAALNSDPPAAVKQKPDHQVLHLMGNRDPYREAVFGTAWSEVCRAAAASTEIGERTLKHQLGVDQANLLALLLQVWPRCEWPACLPASSTTACIISHNLFLAAFG